MRLDSWMDRNLSTQGYCLGDTERRRLRVALRFSTGTCVALVVVALALESEVGTAWLLVVGALLAAGLTTAALVLGGLLVVACATVTLTNLCIPSEAMAWWERRTERKEAIAT